jgi:DNA-binding SARP family transcriptional activator
VPVRLLIAPAGSGKTTLLLKYASGDRGNVRYCTLPQACTPQGLRDRLAAMLNLPSAAASYEAMVDGMIRNDRSAVELIVDDIEKASPEALTELCRIVQGSPDHVTFIFAGCSRETVDVKRWVASGLAVLCDARRLAFDYADTAMLAEICGVPYTELDVRRLVNDTDGWAVATSSAIRCAAADSRSLERAYEHWRTQCGSVFDEFVHAELEFASREDRALIAELLAGSTCTDAARMRQLESRGLFVFDIGDVPRLYRALRPQHRQHAQPAPETAAPQMHVRMFRSFEAQIDGRAIPWVRRRDQQILKYLLLKPSGTATRAELASVFWPDADHHQATQSMRTACSNIRKAFASVVGYASVDLYFRTHPQMQVDIPNVVCDVRRFVAHVTDGDEAYGRGDLASAAAHYRAADGLYAGRLLEFESQEPWYEQHAQALHDRFTLALERLAEEALERADVAQAIGYAERILESQPDNSTAMRLMARARLTSAADLVIQKQRITVQNVAALQGA